MRIESIRLALPSRKLSNDDVLNLVRTHSAATFQGDLDRALARVSTLLGYSGADTRYVLADGESPIEILRRAVDEALDEAQCTPTEIDLLIYTGVGRGFLEPGSAYLVANAMGMDRAQCFDILDACNSWSRAIQSAYYLLQSGSIRRAMIVNAEFNARVGGIGVFALDNMQQLAWTLPTYTIGEAATATVLSRDETRDWGFAFASRPDLADLCTVPLPGFEGYCRATDRVGRNGSMRFSSYGQELFDAARSEILHVFQKLNPDLNKLRAIFTHAASARAADEIASVVGLHHLIRNVYPQCGNIVSASVPGAIAVAIGENALSRGDYVTSVVASAGMSFSACAFTY